MTPGPPVSVIIVNHARPDELALVLIALGYQRHRNFEIIVVSDIAPAQRPPAPAGTRWIAYAEANISAARNLGLAAARGEIVAFIDDDAVPEFCWLSALVTPFSAPEVGAAGGYVLGRNGVSFQWRGLTVDRAGRDRALDLDGPDPQVFAPMADRAVKTVGTNCAFRRQALLDIGGFDESFRFFLDEADVNIRLAADGWSTALVPQAQVHHGFASGPHRSRRRVPTSLHEIGASQAYFLVKHGARQPAIRLSEFRREQRRRLMRLFNLGLLSSARMVRLLASLEAGFADGEGRAESRIIIGADGGSFWPVATAPTGRRRLFVRSPGASTDIARQAAAAAQEGDETTLIAMEASHRPLVVRFTTDGYFRHRIGLAGKSDRASPRRIKGPVQRRDEEIARILPLRGPFVDTF